MLIAICSLSALQSLQAYTYPLCNTSNEAVELELLGAGYCPKIPTFALAPNGEKEYEFPKDWYYTACRIDDLRINDKKPAKYRVSSWREQNADGETFIVGRDAKSIENWRGLSVLCNKKSNMAPLCAQ